jgi:hypothetical protein
MFLVHKNTSDINPTFTNTFTFHQAVQMRLVNSPASLALTVHPSSQSTLHIECQCHRVFHLSQLPIYHSSVMHLPIQTNHCTADSRHYEITLNTMYSIISCNPWLCEWACDDADFTIIFILQSQEWFHIRQ